jgi:CHAT domain-containing protein
MTTAVSPMRHRLSALLVCAGWTLFVGAAAAQDDAQVEERNRLVLSARDRHIEGKFAEAAASLDKALAIDRAVPGGKPEELIDLLQSAAELHASAGDFPAAAARAEEAVKLAVKTFGETNRRTVEARRRSAAVGRWEKLAPADRTRCAEACRLMSAGRQHDQAGKDEEAGKAYAAAAATYGALGGHELEQSRALYRSAMSLRSRNRFAEAETAAAGALAAQEKVLGKDDPDTVRSLMELAFARIFQKKFAPAAADFAEVAARRRRVFGPDDATAQRALEFEFIAHDRGADAAEAAGDFSAALAGRRRALDVLVGLHGEGHWKTTDGRIAWKKTESLSKLTAEQRTALSATGAAGEKAIALRSAGNAGAAAAMVNKAADDRRALVGPEDPTYITLRLYLGRLLTESGQAALGEAVLKDALELSRRVFGENHPRHAGDVRGAAIGFLVRFDFVRASNFLERAADLTRRIEGESSENYAECLMMYGLLHWSRDDAVRAEQAWRRELEIREKNKSPRVADALINLGRAIRERRAAHDESALLLTRAVALLDPPGRPHENLPTALEELARTRAARRQPDEARRLLERAFALLSARLGPNHPRVIAVHAEMADVLRSLGQWDEADARLRDAVTAARAAGDVREVARRTADRAGLLIARARYAEADGLLAESIAVLEQKAPGEKKLLGRVLQSRAETAEARGDRESAAALYERLRRLAESLDPSEYERESLMRAVGRFHLRRGDYGRAEPMLRKSVETAARMYGADHPWTAVSLHALAMMHAMTGDLDQAAGLCRRAVTIADAAAGSHPDCARYRSTLAVITANAGNAAEAEPMLREALALQSKTLGADHSETVQTGFLLAQCLRRRGDYAAAETALLPTLEAASTAERPARRAAILRELAYVRLETGAAAATVEPLLSESLALIRKSLGEGHPDLIDVLALSARAAESGGEPKRAAELLRTALEIARKTTELAAAGQSERQQLLTIGKYRAPLDGLLSLSIRAGLPAEGVYEHVLAWKGAVFARQRSRRLSEAVKGRPEAAAKSRELQAVVNELATLALARPEPAQREAVRDRLGTLTRRRELLESELSAAARDAAGPTRAPGPAQVAAALPADAVLVDILVYTHSVPPASGKGPWRSRRHAAAFVVAPNRRAELIDLGALEPIEKAVEEWRRTFGATVPGQEPAGAKLRRLLWEPIAGRAAGAGTLLVSPDGAIARVPFAALPGSTPDKYLIEEFTVATVPVPALLPVARAALPAGEPAMLLVGDVDYDGTEGAPPAVAAAGASLRSATDPLRNWGPLRSSGEEVIVVQGYFQRAFRRGRATVLERKEAGESAVREEFARSRFIHVATHGFFAAPKVASAGAGGPSLLPDEDFAGYHPGLLSGLVFSGANRPPERGDDGILTALEVSEMDLSGVEMAVLSACETGLGASAGGEGLLGLQRAFQVAGARTVVAGLWKVGDDATRSLMGKFYRNLWTGKMTRMEAFRAAQIEMLRQGVRGFEAEPDKQKPSPYYWAGFVLSGDWR